MRAAPPGLSSCSRRCMAACRTVSPDVSPASTANAAPDNPSRRRDPAQPVRRRGAPRAGGQRAAGAARDSGAGARADARPERRLVLRRRPQIGDRSRPARTESGRSPAAARVRQGGHAARRRMDGEPPRGRPLCRAGHGRARALGRGRRAAGRGEPPGRLRARVDAGQPRARLPQDSRRAWRRRGCARFNRSLAVRCRRDGAAPVRAPGQDLERQQPRLLDRPGGRRRRRRLPGPRALRLGYRAGAHRHRAGRRRRALAAGARARAAGAALPRLCARAAGDARRARGSQRRGAVRRERSRAAPPRRPRDRGARDPASFERLTGYPQEQLTTPPRAADLAWAEPWSARFPDARLAGWLAAARPVVDLRLGGDLTAAFAAAAGSPYTPRPQ